MSTVSRSSKTALAAVAATMEFWTKLLMAKYLDTPVKPGTVRIILADSQAIYRVGIRKVSRWKTIFA